MAEFTQGRIRRGGDMFPGKECTCNMFKSSGDCYHKGFIPARHTPKPQTHDAVKRMQNRILNSDELRERQTDGR